MAHVDSVSQCRSRLCPWADRADHRSDKPPTGDGRGEASCRRYKLLRRPGMSRIRYWALKTSIRAVGSQASPLATCRDHDDRIAYRYDYSRVSPFAVPHDAELQHVEAKVRYYPNDSIADRRADRLALP